MDNEQFLCLIRDRTERLKSVPDYVKEDLNRFLALTPQESGIFRQLVYLKASENEITPRMSCFIQHCLADWTNAELSVKVAIVDLISSFLGISRHYLP